jgi:tripartite-type tricarboxylate transporter receptor subunit TctC
MNSPRMRVSAFSRRFSNNRFVRAMALACALAVPMAAQAESKYPDQTIRLIVPFGVGGLADISLRLVAQKLGERFNEKIIIENRPGAGGVVAASAVMNAPHDGYTLAVLSSGTAISKSLFKLPFDPEKVFTPISTVAYFDLLLLTNPEGKIHNMADLLALGKQRRLVLGTINPGSTQNLSAELFRSTAKLDANIIPFKNTSDVVSALIRGDIDVAFESYAALKGPVDAKRILPIASTGDKRSAWLPNVPTVRESGVDYDVLGWNALFAPTGTPQVVIDTLNRQLAEVLQQPELRKRFEDLGTEAKGSTPAEMGVILHNDIDKWAAVIKQAGIQPQ